MISAGSLLTREGLEPQDSLLPPLRQDMSCSSSHQLSWAASSGYGHTFTLWGQSRCWCCAPHHPSHLPDDEKMESPGLSLLLTPGWNTSWDHPVTVCTSVTKEKSSAAKIFNLELLIKKKGPLDVISFINGLYIMT